MTLIHVERVKFMNLNLPTLNEKTTVGKKKKSR